MGGREGVGISGDGKTKPFIHSLIAYWSRISPGVGEKLKLRLATRHELIVLSIVIMPS